MATGFWTKWELRSVPPPPIASGQYPVCVSPARFGDGTGMLYGRRSFGYGSRASENRPILNGSSSNRNGPSVRRSASISPIALENLKP